MVLFIRLIRYLQYKTVHSQNMMTSNGNIFCVTGPLCGEFKGDWWIPLKRPVTLSFDVFFDLRQNKRWFETPLRSLGRHSNEKGKKCIALIGSFFLA